MNRRSQSKAQVAPAPETPKATPQKVTGKNSKATQSQVKEETPKKPPKKPTDNVQKLKAETPQNPPKSREPAKTEEKKEATKSVEKPAEVSQKPPETPQRPSRTIQKPAKYADALDTSVKASTSPRATPKAAGQKRKLNESVENSSKKSPEVAQNPAKVQKTSVAPQPTPKNEPASPKVIKTSPAVAQAVMGTVKVTQSDGKVVVIARSKPLYTLKVTKPTEKPPQFKQLKITQILSKVPPKTAEVKSEKNENPPVVENFPSVKQEKEENFAITLNNDEYGEIEVLDEFYDEVMNSEIKKEIKTESGMSLRGVKINLSEIGLGKMKKSVVSVPKTPRSLAFLDETSTPSCFQPDRPYRCKKCPLSFRNRKDFGDHRRIHKKADHRCEKCGQRFRFQASYLNHDCDFWCGLCGKSISNKANLKIHMNYVHNVGSAKIFTCDLCGRFYKSKRNIDTHMKNHMAVTPFNCAICGKGFSHAGALKIHMWNHRDVVDCEFCKKKFKPRSLYYHVKKCPKNWELFGSGSGGGGSTEGEEVIAVKEEANVKHTPTKTVMIMKMKK